MKEILVRKLTSRKLWVALLGIAVGLATAFGVEEAEYVQLAGIITSAISTFAYIFGEAKIDTAFVNKTTETTTEVTDNE
jgi:hypothetical protein